MATLKSLAVARGVTIGGGCVDRIHNLHFPSSFADSDPGATIMRTEFSQIDLCPWPKDADGDLWTAPGVVDYAHTDEAYAWAISKGLSVVGVDPAYTSGLLTWLFTSNGKGGWTSPYTAAQLTTILHDYYTAWYSRYPLLDHSSVPNELLPLTHVLTDPPSGGDYCIEPFYQLSDAGAAGGHGRLAFIKTVCQWIKAANANVKILMNQYGAEGANANGASDANAVAFRAWINDLLSLGAPIDGIGVQSHFNVADATALNPTGYGAALTAYRAILPTYITEFDINGAATGWAQAHYDLITAALNAGVTYISVWTARNPLFYGANGALWDAALVATPARGEVESALASGSPPLVATGSQATSAAGSVAHSRKVEVMA